MFKERIKTVAITITQLFLFTVALLSASAISYYIYEFVQIRTNFMFGEGLIKFLLVIFFLALAYEFYRKLKRFVIWLFVEPYKNREREKSND